MTGDERKQNSFELDQYLNSFQFTSSNCVEWAVIPAFQSVFHIFIPVFILFSIHLALLLSSLAE